MGVRLDKWLDVACLFKTRSLAGRACATGKVWVNGSVAKSHRRLALGDRVEIERGEWRQAVEVAELADKHVSKSEARRLYRDVGPPRPAPDPLARLIRAPVARREAGRGRPTKRERRLLDRWRRG